MILKIGLATNTGHYPPILFNINEGQLKNIKSKILAIMQLPPPIHGQSVMNQTIYESKLINESFEFKTIPLHFTALGNIGQPSVNKLWKMVYYLFIIFKELILFKPGLVYFTLSPTGFAFYRDAIYVGLIKLFRVPIAFHLHGKGIKEKTRNSFNRILYHFVFKNSKIILLSKLLADDIHNVINGRGQLYFLANGIKCQTSLVNNNKKIKNDPPVILFLSNMEKTKGLLVLFEAVAMLIQKNIKFKLKLVGGILPSISRDELYKNIDSIGDYVEYFGPKYGDEKLKQLAAADIFAFPTYYEAFPLVLLEAMQAGLPVVSTFEGAIPEIIDNGQNGFLVEQKNSKDLSDKLELLLKNEILREKMGKSGQQKFLNNYTSEIFEMRLNNIFHEIIHEDKKNKNWSSILCHQTKQCK